jgi:hypothetical protein
LIYSGLTFSILFLGFRWPALRFDWKCKSSDPALLSSQKESITKKVENIEKQKDGTEENDASKSSKLPKKEIKEGKKFTGASELDIGVWNPNAMSGNQSDSTS